ncbi:MULTISPECIES: fimbrial chaperone [unclassified Citrobacter]|uniref:fimbrial chaperone n=1 Tax=unclassified Citrobacter TaxID=2644389 RepID=UPI002304787A|nr:MULTISPECIES: fimbrial chaperone [unclassified Citrobacter]MDA8499180.1 fimbrial chaperone [Citrobacter sp. Igbk 17]MDA8517924.1 fimbrial chaperone [Citrobacter sp. Igbk 16]
MMNLTKTAQSALLFSATLLTSHVALADIVISGTRVIYPESAKDVTVNMENRGKKPLLVQTWLDDGRDTTSPQELKLPFVITPPVSRVDAGNGQTVRITWLGQPLPQDRETLFWFNVLEVPSKAKNVETQNMLQLAFRTRIKMFFRPNGLKSSPSTAAAQLTWSQQQQNSKSVLVAHNDSPYYISLAKVTAQLGGTPEEVEPHTVAPFSSQAMALTHTRSAKVAKITYASINDFGGVEQHQAVIK